MFPSITADGLTVAFKSAASNLSPEDPHPDTDGFIRDVRGGSTTLVTHPGKDGSGGPKITADGRFLVFLDKDPRGDGRGTEVVRYDRRTGSRLVVSVVEDGELAHLFPGPSISRDGKRVAFVAYRDGPNPVSEAFVWDEARGYAVGVSKDPDGEPVRAMRPTLSPDGRWLVFWSDDEAMRGDPEPIENLFIQDLDTGETTFIASVGIELHGFCCYNSGADPPGISNDGRYVVFNTYAELVPDDPGGESVYRWERTTGAFELVDRTPSGRATEVTTGEPSISPDGRLIAYRAGRSPAGQCELVSDPAGDQSGRCLSDIVVRDMLTGDRRVVTRTRKGIPADHDSVQPAIAAGGRYVAFASTATNLVPGRPRYRCDDQYWQSRCYALFLADLRTGEFFLVSVG